MNSRTFKKSRNRAVNAHKKEKEIEAVVHALRDQACILGLGISALQYPADSEQERRHYLIVLEGVVYDMNREFQRLDNWLGRVGYKHSPGEALRFRRSARAAKL